jgi:hypothetical protein
MKRDEKEQRLYAFLCRYLERLAAAPAAPDTERALTLLAQSPASPAAGAALRGLEALNAAGVNLRAIFASPEQGAALDQWLAASQSVRVAKDQRLLDAHEQLVLGTRQAWLGDSLRRNPLKSDLYESFAADCSETARRAARAFELIASRCPAVDGRRATASLKRVARAGEPGVPVRPPASPQPAEPAEAAATETAPAGTVH